MLARFNLLVMASFFTSIALLAPSALAQDDDTEELDAFGEEGDAEGGTDDAEADEAAAAGEEENKDEQWSQEQEQSVDDALAADSPVELPGKTYYFVGLRYRGILIPKFMMNLFGDGGTTVYVDSLGPEFGIRKDGFEYIFSLWWADYGMDDTPFKASDDDDRAWEIVKSEINVLYLTADFLWSHDFAPEVALNYGMGAGFGFVWGPLYRTQAYPPAGVTDPYDYEKCTAEGNPNASYCGGDNDHYDNYEEPSWSGGGSKPVIFPWFALQTGLRVKPHRNFVARLDMGFGISGFFFGLGLDYGI